MMNKTYLIGDEEITVNYLMYKSYEFQRSSCPDVDPERWRKLYFYQENYEKIYQTLKDQYVII